MNVKWPALCSSCFSPMERLLVPIQQEAGWISEHNGEDRNLCLLPGEKGTHVEPETYSKE